jgi:Caspase domain
MTRAAIIIGVDRAGDLPVLKDAAAGARRFEQWVLKQNFSAVKVITDENEGAVDVTQIKRAIRDIVDSGTIEQLIVYFAGHGVNIHYGEYWLLSDAPRDSNAAVNVKGSEELARYAGIPHVLFVSDACRTAAQGIQAQGISGSEIFPNDANADTEKPVDQFFACTLGRPALEIPDKDVTAREFKALYTAVLLDGLHGTPPLELEWKTEGGASVAYVHPRPLRDYLHDEVPRRLASLDLATKAIQIPDAHIASDPPAWVARLTGLAPPPPVRSGPDRPPVSVQPFPTPSTLSTALVQAALNAEGQDPLPQVEKVIGRLAPEEPIVRSVFDKEAMASPATLSILDTFRLTAAPVGPMHQETRCGFKVRGAKILEAFSLLAKLKPFERPGELVQVGAVDPPGASALLVFDSLTGVVVPAIPDFLVTLTVEDGELVDVSYEPSDNTDRWNEFRPRAKEIRALRALASASTRNGVFSLEGDDALTVARRMQFAKGLDPTLAIYAAHAYDRIGRRDLIREMSGYMRADLGARLFDIALLAGELDGGTAGRDRAILGFMPLLAQGWALLAARRVSLPESLRDIRSKLISSVWTMFDAAGIEQIRSAMQKGDVI